MDPKLIFYIMAQANFQHRPSVKIYSIKHIHKLLKSDIFMREKFSPKDYIAQREMLSYKWTSSQSTPTGHFGHYLMNVAPSTHSNSSTDQ